MSQSNDSPAPCADKGGHGKATTSVCDTLRSERSTRTEEKKPRNGDDEQQYVREIRDEWCFAILEAMATD